MSTVDVNRVIVTGENAAIRLSPTDGDSFTTNASFWRILSSAGGSGHVLYLNSELTSPLTKSISAVECATYSMLLLSIRTIRSASFEVRGLRQRAVTGGHWRIYSGNIALAR